MTTVTIQDVIREKLRVIDKADDPETRYDDYMLLAEQLYAQLRGVLERGENMEREDGFAKSSVFAIAEKSCRDPHLYIKEYLSKSGLVIW